MKENLTLTFFALYHVNDICHKLRGKNSNFFDFKKKEKGPLTSTNNTPGLIFQYFSECPIKG